MAEAEDVLIDVLRHATVYSQNLWRRCRPAAELPQTITLPDIAPRLDLFINTIFGHSYPLKVSQLPARPTFLGLVFGKVRKPYQQQVVPATNDRNIWLPLDSGLTNASQAREYYQVMALQQIIRAKRNSATRYAAISCQLTADIYLLQEAFSADAQLIELLPGMAKHVKSFRQLMLERRPPLDTFYSPRQPVEQLLRLMLQHDGSDPTITVTKSSRHSVIAAAKLIRQFELDSTYTQSLSQSILLKDCWTGDLLPVDFATATANMTTTGIATEKSPPRSSKMQRRPDIRTADEDEDETEPGAWMVQADESHAHAEDPFGMQRPTDRDETIPAEEFSEMVSELAEARLVSTPDQAKEILLSDDSPELNAKLVVKAKSPAENQLEQTWQYPEWDYRQQSYQQPGATVRLMPIQLGSQQWVDVTLQEHKVLLAAIRRQFAMLQPQRVTRRKQTEGDEIDLDAYIASYADYRAGHTLSERLYQQQRPQQRNMAITLLIDISGSTDGWVSANRRVIDVEREALLLVCYALEGLAEPYSVLAFSGEGQHGVTVQQIKPFSEHFTNDTALKISALEPQYYTRAGAALRHASNQLMAMPADHRLLILLSDGKPNDNDDYEGQYGAEDMRMAVTEAKLQGIYPFCLTIDRQAADYLPKVFGPHQYALLPEPEHLPSVLLDWLKKLVV